MTTKTKIIIGILIVTAIGVAVLGITMNLKNNKTEKHNSETDYMLNYFNEESKEDENIIENNIIEVNEIEEKTIANTNVTNVEVQPKQNSSESIVGKEEQESNTENTEIQNENKAIELAKKAWGMSTEDYLFETQINSDGTYDVTVKNKTTTAFIRTYNVNVQTESVVRK